VNIAVKPHRPGLADLIIGGRKFEDVPADLARAVEAEIKFLHDLNTRFADRIAKLSGQGRPKPQQITGLKEGVAP
jgi:hypothetical protein